MALLTRTILFTDLVSSTQLRTAIGDRRAERLRTAHFERLRHELPRHAGREIKTLGDGIMAVFDSARQGIECGISMQQAEALCITSGDAPAPMRLGISSGDVHIEQGDCFGIPVIEASRLCAAAAGGQILISECTRLLARDYAPLRTIGARKLKGLLEPTITWEAPWSPQSPRRVRAVLADDAVLFREGVAQVLEAAGIEVVGQAGNPEQLLQLTNELRPDVAIVDLRMPPTYTIEGLEIAEQIRSDHPATSVLLLSQELEPRHARRLAAASPTGVGYLLKERVTDLRAFTDATRHIAAGGTLIQPELLTPAAAST